MSTTDWIRREFGAESLAEAGLPGGDLVDAGLADLEDGRVTAESLLVSLAAPRLRREGIPVPRPLDDPEWRLFSLLRDTEGDLAHERYNALLRNIVSFANSCALARSRRLRH